MGRTFISPRGNPGGRSKDRPVAAFSESVEAALFRPQMVSGDKSRHAPLFEQSRMLCRALPAGPFSIRHPRARPEIFPAPCLSPGVESRCIDEFSNPSATAACPSARLMREGIRKVMNQPGPPAGGGSGRIVMKVAPSRPVARSTPCPSCEGPQILHKIISRTFCSTRTSFAFFFSSVLNGMRSEEGPRDNPDAAHL